MALRSLGMLIGWVAFCLAAGWVGAAVTAPALVDWYPALLKPAWTPPDAAFPIVWTVLYLMMGVAAWLVWHRLTDAGESRYGQGLARWLPLFIFLLQLGFNVLWSMLFFGLRDPALGAVDILLLLAAIVATVIAFRPISSLAAALLLPYLIWVGYAAALNLAIWRMNPAA